LAVSTDTIVVGASGLNTYTGAAYVFAKTAAGWTQQAKLTASDPTVNSGFGGSLAVLGTTMIVGAGGPCATTGKGPGAAYVFTKAAVGWTQHSKLTGDPNSPCEFFGSGVALANTSVGLVAVVGTGAQIAYEYTRTTSGWSRTAAFNSPIGDPYDLFGFVFAAEGLPNSTVIFGDTYPTSGNYTGAAYVFPL
jgi:hypothetical protein